VTCTAHETSPNAPWWRRLLCNHRRLTRYHVDTHETVAGCAHELRLSVVACPDCGHVIRWEHSDTWDPRKPDGMERLIEAANAFCTRQAESANDAPPDHQCLRATTCTMRLPIDWVPGGDPGGFLRHPVTDISRAFDEPHPGD
jgi:hypothetical protein